jgi:hypothetical protein
MNAASKRGDWPRRPDFGLAQRRIAVSGIAVILKKWLKRYWKIPTI